MVLKRTSILLLTFLLVLSAAGAAMAASVEAEAFHRLKVTVPEVTKLELTKAGQTIEFEDIEEAGTYTTDESFTLTYRCNKKVNWQLKVEAGKFKDGQEELPVSALNIRIVDNNETYNILGQEAVLDTALNTGAKEKTIEFLYELKIDSDFSDVYAGEYSNEVTYTLFVP